MAHPHAYSFPCTVGFPQNTTDVSIRMSPQSLNTYDRTFLDIKLSISHGTLHLDSGKYRIEICGD